MQSQQDYQKIFTEIIKKQILVLGPDITLAKVRNVQGLEIDSSGQVTKIIGDPQVILQKLIDQFVELSGMIVKKTMESILSTYPDGISDVLSAQSGHQPQEAVAQQASTQPLQPHDPVMPPQNSVVPPVQNVQPQPIPASGDGSAQDSDIDELNKMVNDINSTAQAYQDNKVDAQKQS